MKKTRRVWTIVVLVSLLTIPFGHIRPGEASQMLAYVSILLSGARVRESAPAVADFNGDGIKEIVVGGVEGIIYVIAFTGMNWEVVWSHQVAQEINAANPPTYNSDNYIRTSAAIADLENDGHLEIVVTVGGDPHEPVLSDHRNGGVLVYRYNSPWNFSITGQAVYNPTTGQCENAAGQQGGWPQPCIDQMGWPAPGYSNADGYWDGIMTTPALGDLDGDGDLEIVVEGLDRRIHAWHHDGSIVNGWPISQWNGDNLWRGGISSPALGDLDNDGLPEVVVGTMSAATLENMTHAGTIWAINGDSSLVPGFPVETEQYIYSSPALGDIDNDGMLEIVVGAGMGISSARMNLIYALNHDGTPVQMPGGTAWPQVAGDPNDALIAAPALGDIDGDGQLEVVIGGTYPYGAYENNLYAWNADGSVVTGFPTKPRSPSLGLSSSYPMPYTPILADFDSDGTIEILVTHIGSPGISIVEPNGVTSDYTNYTFPGWLDAPPVVADIDNDGLLEIIVAGENVYNDSHGEVRIWDVNGTTSDALPWAMYRHDMRRTGLAPLLPRLEFTDAIHLFHDQGDPNPTESGYVYLINTGGETFDWSLTASAAINLSRDTGSGESGVSFSINTTGLSQGWNEVGTITASATYDGEPVSGSPQTATVYVFIGDIARVCLPLVNHN